jgi:hypothetical protein
MRVNNDNKNRSILVLGDEIDSIIRCYGQNHAFNVHSFPDLLLAVEHFKLNPELLRYEVIIVDMRMSTIINGKIAVNNGRYPDISDQF